MIRHIRGGNLPTIDDIEYNTEVLRKMNESELLYQLICREDLKQPNRPHAVDAADFKVSVVKKVGDMADALDDADLDHFAEQLRSMLRKYIDAEPVVV